MKILPRTEEVILLRTDFTCDAAWKTICKLIRLPDKDTQKGLALFASINNAIGQVFGKIETPLCVVDDPDYSKITTDKILELLPQNPEQFLLFVVDEVCISEPDHPVLVIDLEEKPGRTFRTIPSQAFNIENNLSTANMDWEDFAAALDNKGVFRGFDEADLDEDGICPGTENGESSIVSALRNHLEVAQGNYLAEEAPSRIEKYRTLLVAVSNLSMKFPLDEAAIRGYLGEPDLPRTDLGNGHSTMLYFLTPDDGGEQLVAYVAFLNDRAQHISFGVKEGIAPLLLDKLREQEDEQISPPD